MTWGHRAGTADVPKVEARPIDRKRAGGEGVLSSTTVNGSQACPRSIHNTSSNMSNNTEELPHVSDYVRLGTSGLKVS